MNHLQQIIASGCVAAIATAAAAQHADVAPRVADFKIVTDAFSDGGGGTAPDVRVFGYDFQEDPADPYFAGDPGFNAQTGSGLPVSSQVTFNVLSPSQFGLPANLSYWNGTGPASWSSVSNSETLRINFGAQNRVVGTGTGEIAGFSLGTVGAGGTLHRHLNSFLQGSDGDSDPTNGAPPTDGIYLLALELTSSDSSIADSDPFFIVFNNGLTEGVHDEAIEFVQATFVPEPSSAMIAIGAACFGLTGRGKRRRA